MKPTLQLVVLKLEQLEKTGLERHELTIQKMEETYAEVKKTNGRVTELEKWRILRDEVAKTKIGELDLITQAVKVLTTDKNVATGRRGVLIYLLTFATGGATVALAAWIKTLFE